jgi:hypothetical protein
VNLSRALDRDLTDQNGSGGGSPVEARVSSSPARSWPGVDLRRCSGGLCSTAMLGQGAEGHGESACKVCVEDGFQWEARKAAGGAPGAGIFQVTSRSSFRLGRKGGK